MHNKLLELDKYQALIIDVCLLVIIWLSTPLVGPEAPGEDLIFWGVRTPVLPPLFGVFRGYTPQKRQKWRSGPILGATANFGASIL